MQSSTMVQVVDARPSGRFKGINPESRPNISSGHIPNSINVPFTDCMTSESKIMKSIPELDQLFKAKGVDLNSDFVTTCGSGISACILAYAVFLCNGREVPVYDGSWVEWATKARDHIVQEDQ